MIINFSVENFGSIKDRQTLSFEASKKVKGLEEYYIAEPIKGLHLLKLAMIYGANASGKSTILKALDFFKNITLKPLVKKNEELNFNPFLFDPLTPDQNSLFSLEFVQRKIKYLYNIEFNRKAIVNEELYQYNPNKALVYKRTTNLDKQLATITFGGNHKMPSASILALESNTLWNNSVLGGFLRTNINSETLTNIIDWFNITLAPVVQPTTDLHLYISNGIREKKTKKENILKILKKADLMISDILFEKEVRLSEKDVNSLKQQFPNIDVDRALKTNEVNITSFQHSVKSSNNVQQNYMLPLYLESIGTQRYYGLAGFLDETIRRNGILPIDEIDSSLHPDLFEHFLLTFLSNAKNSQLILTTHYREFLMQRDMFRNDAIWFTEKKADGSTDLYSAADFDSSVIRKESSIYNAYKIGKLGATPNLGDYYIDFEDDGETN